VSCGDSCIHILICCEFSCLITMTSLGKFIIFVIDPGGYIHLYLAHCSFLYFLGALPIDLRTNPL
jgi:hypothetical protein